MGEQNNSATRGRKRKGSSKSSTKSNKRKASGAGVIVKSEPISSSPISLPKNLELSTAGISQNSLPNENPQQQPPINDKLPILSGRQINLTNIPNEIFVHICANLHPSDLLSLTLVCQKLRGLLCSLNSHTQAIWRNSRTKFLRFFQSPPPSGMDEKSYIVLKQLEKGCQFCHETGFVKVYWEFRVRCCEPCLDKNTMSRDKLFIDYCIPDEVFRTLPYIFRIASRFYWIRDVSQAYNEFCKLDEEEKQDWVEQREVIANNTMQETIKHKHEEQNEQVAKFEESLTAQSPNPNYTPQPLTPQQRILVRQPQLTNFAPMTSMTSMASMASLNSMANMSSVPTIPSMGTMGTIGLTSSQPQFQQFDQSQLIIPQMQSVMPFNRSQFMITTPPAQQFYSNSPFVSRITRHVISQQHMIPSHMMAGAPQTLTPPQMLTPQMISPPCYGAPQMRRL